MRPRVPSPMCCAAISTKHKTESCWGARPTASAINRCFCHKQSTFFEKSLPREVSWFIIHRIDLPLVLSLSLQWLIHFPRTIAIGNQFVKHRSVFDVTKPIKCVLGTVSGINERICTISQKQIECKVILNFCTKRERCLVCFKATQSHPLIRVHITKSKYKCERCIVKIVD